MSNRGAIIRFISAAICVVLFMTYTSIKELNSTDSETIIKTQAPTIFDGIVIQNIPLNITPQNTQTGTSSTTSSDQSIMVSASGAVQGKVIEKFLSPYTANTSYKNVYLKNNTELKINLKDFVDGKLDLKIEKNAKPQVLILHTHATESYLRHNENYYTENDTSRNTDNAYNMVALGKIISDKLNAAGIVTLHDTTQHDNPSYNDSYNRAAKTICDYTKKYPSIKVVIDLHRDALAENDTDKVKLTTEINGKSGTNNACYGFAKRKRQKLSKLA